MSLPSDKSFASFDEARANLAGPPLADDTTIYWQDCLLDVAFVYDIQSDRSRFAIRPGLTRLGLNVNVVMRLLTPGNPERAFDVHGETGIVELDPRWHQAARRFTRDGFFHILDGTDHLLFLLCLVIPFRRLRPLVAVVTAFTVAHSITLIASAFNLAPTALWFPPLIETLIALSIVYMAVENITGAHLERRWLVTFGFGLVHGFGFSFALRESLQFAGSHLLTSLLAFNVGVELGQVLVLLIVLPLLTVLFRRVVDARVGAIILSAFVAHTAWHWLTERWATLSKFRPEWPVLDAEFAVAALRWAMLIVLAVLAAWLVRPAFAKASARRPPVSATRSRGPRAATARRSGRSVVACASSVPCASSSRPSATLVRRPRCSTRPMPRTGPVASVMGFSRFTLSSTVV